MLLPARDKARRARAAERIRFIEADTQRLPFPSDSFQLTTVAFGLRNVTDTDKGIAEMVRVTQPGGRVAILEFSRPQHWLFGRAYRFYFKKILPAIGQLVSRSQDSAYNYLPASVMEFPDGEALAERLRSHGLTEVRWYPLTFGIATLYIGRKTHYADFQRIFGMSQRVGLLSQPKCFAKHSRLNPAILLAPAL